MRVKTGREMSEMIIMGIFFAGAITVASPFFIIAAMPKIIQSTKQVLKNRKNYQNTFSKLKGRGLIKVTNRKGQIYISLTKKGKERAGRYQIDNMEIKKDKKWDKKWRILIFDIKNEQKIKRESLRGKIKQLGLFQLQKSVWIHPYDIQNEMNLLRNFFGLTKKEMQIIIADRIENDKEARTFFKLLI